MRDGVSISDLSASFQQAVVDSLVEKAARAAKTYDATEIMIAGGVSANKALRQAMRHATDLPVRCPPLNLCTDNGAMIAAAAHYRFLDDLRDDGTMEVIPMWPLTSDAYAHTAE